MIQIENFSLDEFDAAGEPGTGGNMRAGTLLKLQAMRAHYGSPLSIRHGFRTAKAAQRIRASYPGAVKNSAHEGGYAVDIMPLGGFTTIESWLNFLEAAWEAGFRRFGIMAHTVHLDDDPKRVSPAMWDYPGATLPNIWAIVHDWFQKKKSNGG